MKSLLTVEELSQYLHKSVASIRSDATRNPQSLPPICRLPNTKRLLWRLEDVEGWLAAHVEGMPRPAAAACPDVLQPRRGRPTKAEQVARQRQSQHRKQASAHPTEAAAEV
ncbi:TPA: DNA-binding protein [Burkholderia vietnamiensis]|nr:DNA-binding protein [Burkholderia vietnamiensis]